LPTPKGSKRDKQLTFDCELLKEFRYVKDLFRNKVMHKRVTYDAKQAESAFEHVRNFMQTMAGKV
jgi:hypothetical protein